jgi:pectinesterase|tara:strand:+ start:22716 stop:23051 length:336 start_codon:yes stop_codon:yes gene_type:complete
VPNRSVTLARPWHPTNFTDGRYADPNAVGQVLSIDCFIDAHIDEQHYSTMSGAARDGRKPAILKPQDSRFQESGSVGAGPHSTATDIDWQPPWDVSDLYHAFFINWKQGNQ